MKLVLTDKMCKEDIVKIADAKGKYFYNLNIEQEAKTLYEDESYMPQRKREELRKAKSFINSFRKETLDIINKYVEDVINRDENRFSKISSYQLTNEQLDCLFG